MICEQMLYGLFSNIGYQTLTSPNVKRILTKQSIEQIKGLKLQHSEESSIIQLHFKTEDAITITHLTRTQDNYGRKGIMNHTIIIKIADYLTFYPPLALVKDHLSCRTWLTLNQKRDYHLS